MANQPDVDLKIRDRRQQHSINRFACPHCKDAKFTKEEPLWNHYTTHHASLIPATEKEQIEFRAVLRHDALSTAYAAITSKNTEDTLTPRGHSKKHCPEKPMPLINDETSRSGTPAQSIQLDVRIAGLSLDQAQKGRLLDPDSSGCGIPPFSAANKRPASSDIWMQASERQAGHARASGATAASGNTPAPTPPSKYVKRTVPEPRAPQAKSHSLARGEPVRKQLYDPDRSQRPPSRKITTKRCVHNPEPPPQNATLPPTNKNRTEGKNSIHINNTGIKGILELPPTASYSNMILQPDSKPLTHQQLAAEVKGIYSALLLVEAKCIKLDSAQTTAESKHQNLAPEQWQALIALHRTLLYEHHDFLSATQHPSAGASLRSLVQKYSMPARMWKHGIHSFLEVLRHRLPASIDYMLQFIYIAYQMMALLYETEKDKEEKELKATWIECLGDLARYRMAIEEDDMRDREIWGGTARMWYSKASNIKPDVGRLYHHLGILARPNAVQQLYFYCRSLISDSPFPSAQESLRALFEPLIRFEDQADYQPRLPCVDSTDAMFVYLQAAMFRMDHAKKDHDEKGHSGKTFQRLQTSYLSRLESQIEQQGAKWKEHGVFIAVANVAACLQFGKAENALLQAFNPTDLEFGQQQIAAKSEVREDLSMSYRMLHQVLAIVLRRNGDYNVLPYVHVVLIFIRSVCLVGASVLAHRVLQGFPWKDLAVFLNSFSEREVPEDTDAGYKRIAAGGEVNIKDTLTTRIASSKPGTDTVEGKEGSKETLPKPLPEEYLVRGMIWCQSYFSENWFENEDDEEDRLADSHDANRIRAQRVFLISLELSKQPVHLEFVEKLKTFSSSSDVEYTLPDRVMLEPPPARVPPKRLWDSSSNIKEAYPPLDLNPDMGLGETVVGSKGTLKVQIADEDDLQYGVC